MYFWSVSFFWSTKFFLVYQIFFWSTKFHFGIPKKLEIDQTISIPKRLTKSTWTPLKYNVVIQKSDVMSSLFFHLLNCRKIERSLRLILFFLKIFPFLIAPPISKLFPTAVSSLGLPAIFWIHRCVSCIPFLVQPLAATSR